MLPFKCAPWLARNTSIAVLAAGLSGCSSQPPSTTVTCAEINYSVYDPAEPLNRGVFAFNRVLDDYALAPVARGYRYSPDFFQAGVHNFVANFGEPKVFINDLLQGNLQNFRSLIGRRRACVLWMQGSVATTWPARLGPGCHRADTTGLFDHRPTLSRQPQRARQGKRSGASWRNP